MAMVIGSQAADTLVGVSGENDTLIGLGGADVINGFDGDDLIVINSAAELSTAGVAPFDNIDGGTGIDTLETELMDSDVINNDGITPDTIWGVAGVVTNNIEMVKVSNASDFMLDLADDAFFAWDAIVALNDPAASVTKDLQVAGYDASTGIVANTAIADAAEGLVINGVTYMDGDDFTAADGGTIDVTFALGEWSLTYTPAAESLYAVGDAGSSADDVAVESFVATVTNTDGTTVDVSVDITLNLDNTFTAATATAGIISRGDAGNNSMTGSNFDDIIWAGKGDTGADILNGLQGNDVLAGGAGNDNLSGGEGNDTLYAGSGNDVALGNEGDDEVWGGAGSDNLDGGDGNDVIGGGADGDIILGGAGDDVVYGGADDGNDNIAGDDGDDTIYGGAGDDTLNGGNDDDLIFNGAGDDSVVGGLGNDTLWGGAGNDTLTGNAGDDVFAFVAGNGNDVITAFGFDTLSVHGNDVLDLTGLGFASTQDVIDHMTDDGADTTLAIAPGQTIVIEGALVADFQAAVDDWVLV